mmetsp:Transcript_21819/g.60616  ORF Transcript_21819/g.60616 Transcript_21819/m.60616 type:complete len:246 (-) Transcript_21819:478-1215(-)
MPPCSQHPPGPRAWLAYAWLQKKLSMQRMLLNLLSSLFHEPRRMPRMRSARSASLGCSTNVSAWTIRSTLKKACKNSKSRLAEASDSMNDSSVSISSMSSSAEPGRTSRALISMSIADGLILLRRLARAAKSPVSAPMASARENSVSLTERSDFLAMRLTLSSGSSWAPSTSNTGCLPISAEAIVGRKKGAASGFFTGSTGLLRSLIMSITARASHWLRGRRESVTSSGSLSPSAAAILPSASRS